MKENLRNFFGFLHFLIIAEFKAKIQRQAVIPWMTPSEYLDYYLDNNDGILLELIYALATGKMTINYDILKNPGRKDDSLKKFFAVCVAKGMIERVNSNNPRPL